jgi:hypothetical protein
LFLALPLSRPISEVVFLGVFFAGALFPAAFVDEALPLRDFDFLAGDLA